VRYLYWPFHDYLHPAPFALAVSSLFATTQRLLLANYALKYRLPGTFAIKAHAEVSGFIS
jgi:hypothetical protein